MVDVPDLRRRAGKYEQGAGRSLTVKALYALPMTVAKSATRSRRTGCTGLSIRCSTAVYRPAENNGPVALPYRLLKRIVLLIVKRCPLIAYALHFRSHLLRHASLVEVFRPKRREYDCASDDGCRLSAGKLAQLRMASSVVGDVRTRCGR